MKIKKFALISAYVLSLSNVIPEVYAQGESSLEEEPSRLFHPHNFNMPERYGRLQKLKEEALRLAKQEVPSSSVSPRKQVIFRNTVEIHKSDTEKNEGEEILVTSLDDRVTIKSHKIVPNSQVRRKFSTFRLNPVNKTVSKKPTRHVRGNVIMDKEQLFAQPVSLKTRQYIEKVLTPKKLRSLSLQELEIWAKRGHEAAEYMLSVRLYQSKKPIEALGWLEHGIQRGDKKSISLQDKILGMLQNSYLRISNEYAARQKIKVQSELNNPCLPSRVPLFPFLDEKIASHEKWKKIYMRASRMLIDDPSSSEAYNLLLSVAATNPDFKEIFYRLYLIEKKNGNLIDALKCLKKAASGPQGLDVAQYQLGLERKAQGKLGMARFWFKKASAQQYWLADKELMSDLLIRNQKIESILKRHNHLNNSAH